MKTPHVKLIPRSPLRLGLPRVQRMRIIRGLLLIPLLFGCFALSPAARAVCREGCDLTNLNTFLGDDALINNTTGNDNTASGLDALWSNTTGFGNTATGLAALFYNTTGSDNTADGLYALYSNTTINGVSGHDNTATGFKALVSNTTGASNVANGVNALYSNTTGNSNSATGFGALKLNTQGNNNTANGYQALLNNTGSSNIGLGVNAGSTLTTGSGNVCLGAGVTGVAGESNTTRIRNVYASIASARAVYVNADNKIGTLASSRRFKDEIKPMDKASETILALKPVTFRYKPEFDPGRTQMFGLVAEEVEKVNPDLVTRNDKGEVETVRYDAVNAMLLNEFLKEHSAFLKEQRKVEEQDATIAWLKQDFHSKLAEQENQIKALTSGLQKVNNQLELSKPAPQTVLNNQ